MPETEDSLLDRTYQIGTVSTLTGLDPHTIRAWERRYGAIKPARTDTGRRRYDDGTVERLQLLKALVDCAEPIGSIAHLSDPELRDRLAKLADHGSHRPVAVGSSEDAGADQRLALLAPGLARQIEANAVAFSGLELVVSGRDREAFLESARQQACEIVILELDHLEGSPLGFVQACRSLPGNPLVVILYQFAPRASLARLAGAGAKLIRTPVRLDQLRRSVLDSLMIERARTRSAPPAIDLPVPAEADPSVRAAAPERRYDDQQLARLFEITTGVDCECPNHLSALVSGLVAFEDYSRACESRDEADAALHGRLADGTGRARAVLEELLDELCEHEGISV